MAAAPPAASGEPTLLEILRTIARYRLLILAVLAIGLGAAVLVLAAWPPAYRAEAQLLIDPTPDPLGEAPLTTTGISSDSAGIDSQVRIIASRAMAGDVVDALGLADDAELAGLTSPLRLWRARLARSVGFVAEAAATDVEPSRRDVVDGLLERLEVHRDGNTHVITIGVTVADPEKAARIANSLADHYVQSQLLKKHQATRRAQAWLREQLGATREKLEAAEARLAAFLENVPDGLVESDAGSAGTGELRRDLVTVAAEREAKEAELERMRRLLRETPEDVAYEALGGSAVLEDLYALKARLERQEAELAGEYGERHPRIIDIRAQKNELESRITSEQRALVDRMAAEVEQARRRETRLGRELEALKSDRVQRHGAELRLVELRRQVELHQEVYDSYRARLDSIADWEDVQSPDARVISQAVPPGSPAFPKPRMVFSMAFGGSLVLALVLVYVLEQVDRGFRHQAGIERETGLPCLGLVPRLEISRRSRLLPQDAVIDRPRSRYAETMRGLLAGLAVSGRRRRARVVLLTSSLPGEGKSTTALSLARVAALEGLRVLLVDGDLRRPRLHELLGLEPRAGLAEVLKGEAAIEKAVLHDEPTGLLVLPGTGRTTQPTRLLGEEGLGLVIDRLSELFDLVVVDSAPLAAVGDARVIGRLADDVVFLVRWQATPKATLMQCLNGLAEFRDKLRGTLLTFVAGREHAQAGYGLSAPEARKLAEYYVE